ncbi:MAG TPA: hypothetical protein VJ276_02595, partial [Thermoanaerobaculia bacterium]|nr:hypothetical protein [Thermoanaerobaculia bacterium]
MIAALLLAAAVASCRAEYCAKTKDVTACKCYGSDDATYSLRIKRGTKTLYDAKQDVVNFENDTIEVRRLDLDADGKPEIIVADFAGMSNGMGVRYWNLIVLDGRTARASAMKVQDYGKGSFRKDNDGSYTILETSWDWMG